LADSKNPDSAIRLALIVKEKGGAGVAKVPKISFVLWLQLVAVPWIEIERLERKKNGPPAFFGAKPS
jgi:hypothetical protein